MRFTKRVIPLILLLIFSCTEKEDYLNSTIHEEKGICNTSIYKLNQDEVKSKVVNFLETFYQHGNFNTRMNNDFKIKDIFLLTENDLPQDLQTRTSNNELRIDSLLYLINLEEGYVIAGADKRTIPIFAIIDSGNISKDIIKYINRDLFLTDYIERVIYRINEDIEDNVLYDENSIQTRAYPIKEKIFPLLGTTKWDQSYNPYNAYCPEGMPHAGCSATAMAQVSSYYKSPKSVFYGDNIEENPLNKGFQLNLNWDLINSTSNRNYGYMPEADYFFDHTNTPNVSQQIGLYIRYVGKIVNANYKPTGTSATFNNIIKFMRNIIGLQATDQHQFNRKNIYNQIKGGNLVVLAGSANSTGGLFPSRSDGHMWIADGVFVSDHDHYYFHYNWGWSGQHNGYFFEDRWNPGKKEFDDYGNETPQGDYGMDFKYNLKCSYISW